MEILITGGGGFIGSHLCDRLIEEGYEVIAVDNFCSSKKENIEHLLDHERFELIEQDLLEPLEIEGELDYVMHFASRASPPRYQENPLHTIRTNTDGTLKMVELAHEHDAGFMFSSTSEVYGDPEEHPQSEDYNGNVSTTGPRACYDEGKRCGEAIITSFARKIDLDYRIIRIFNTYGPRMMEDDGRVITNFLKQALNDESLTVYGDGSQTRSFCYIDDLVDGIIKAMGSESGEVFNLGNPDEITIIDLAKRVQRLVDTTSEITHTELPKDDPKKRKPDIGKATRRLDWNPKIELNEGLKETYKYYQSIQNGIDDN